VCGRGATQFRDSTLLRARLQVQLRHSKRKAAAIKDLLSDAHRAEGAATGGGGGRSGADRDASGSARALLRALRLSAGGGAGSAGSESGGGGSGFLSGDEGDEGGGLGLEVSAADGEAASLIAGLGRAARACS
jgi:hypothetical protein